MSITKRNYKIYQEATAEGAPSMTRIGRKYHLSRQRVSVIVKQVQAELGEDAQQLPAAEKLPYKLSNFYVNERQEQGISQVSGRTRSDQLRAIIAYYDQNKMRSMRGFRSQPAQPYSILIGGLCVNEEQKQIIDSVPRQSYSDKMRYLIDFYISFN